MDKTTIDKINKSGLKKNYLASLLDIKPSMLSMAINGSRFLKPEKEQQLKDLVKHVQL